MFTPRLIIISMDNKYMDKETEKKTNKLSEIYETLTDKEKYLLEP